MGFGIPAQERRALEQTYEDTATIMRMGYRAMGAIDRREPMVVYTNITCALSRSPDYRDYSKQTVAQQNIDYDCALFAAPELTVRPGDRVAVRRFDQTMEFEVVGRPAMYETHQKIMLKGRELA